MRYLKTFAFTAALMAQIPNLAFAHTLLIDQTLPNASVKNISELMLKGKDMAYTAWESAELTGKARVIFAIAGRSHAKKLITPMIEAITQAKFPADKYQTTTIINLKDTIWGTGSFVTSSAKDSKTEFNWSSFVLDNDATVAKKWGLKEKSAVVIVLDPQNRVQFIKEGELSNKDVTEVIELINKMIV